MDIEGQGRMRKRKGDSDRGQRGTEECANQDGQHLVWVVLDNTEEGRRVGLPAHGAAKR